MVCSGAKGDGIGKEIGAGSAVGCCVDIGKVASVGSHRSAQLPVGMDEATPGVTRIEMIARGSEVRSTCADFVNGRGMTSRRQSFRIGSHQNARHPTA